MNNEEEKKGGEGFDEKMMNDTAAEDDLSNYVTVDGVIIKQDFDYLIMEENEVDKYTPLQSATMEQTLYVPYQHDIQVLGYFLHSYYAQVDVEFPRVDTAAQPDDMSAAAAQQPMFSAAKHEFKKYDIKFLVEGQIEVLYYRKQELLQVKWLTSPKNDLVADSVCLLVMQIKENPTP